VGLSLEEAQAILAALVLMAGERKGNAAFALADLLSRRELERPCETPRRAFATETPTRRDTHARRGGSVAAVASKRSVS
jgi:hypothetical protein